MNNNKRGFYHFYEWGQICTLLVLQIFGNCTWGISVRPQVKCGKRKLNERKCEQKYSCKKFKKFDFHHVKICYDISRHSKVPKIMRAFFYKINIVKDIKMHSICMKLRWNMPIRMNDMIWFNYHVLNKLELLLDRKYESHHIDRCHISR